MSCMRWAGCGCGGGGGDDDWPGGGCGDWPGSGARAADMTDFRGDTAGNLVGLGVSTKLVIMPIKNFKCSNFKKITDVSSMNYESSKKDGKLSVRASAIIRTPPNVVLRAHADCQFASAFRDIGKYTLFQQDGDVIRTAYSSRISFLNIPMAVHKRISSEHVDFWTPPSAMVSFRGRWTIEPHGTGSRVSLAKTVDVPVWSRFLPVESAVKSRIMRAYEDLEGLERAVGSGQEEQGDGQKRAHAANDLVVHVGGAR